MSSSGRAFLDEVIDSNRLPKRILSKKVHKMKDKNANPLLKKYIFAPPELLEKQTDKLLKTIQTGDWNRMLYIKGYKGTFKIEHWITVETNLRDVRHLQAIGFVDTQLDKVHLDVLSKWLSWIEPEQLLIELQQNELDDEDCKDFLYFLFERSIDLKSVRQVFITQIYIMGNPGIYKGVLLQELELYLLTKFAKSSEYFYQLIKNTDVFSVAILRLSRKATEEEKDGIINLAQCKINQTQYYKVNINSCFTEQNWKGFQDLIQNTYKEENLEQLSHLDASNNYLGTQSAFNSMCEQMSTAKGLLVLRLGSQPLIHNATTVQTLMGNRYDTLRLNLLDISYNADMHEKAFQLLSENIFKSCQIINLSQCLTQQLPTLNKLFVLVEAFAIKTKENRQLYDSKKIYRKDYLQVLNLGSVENYNRHDLVEKLLLNSVFTEFSNISKLYVQNLDVGRCQAYIKAIRKFASYMIKMQDPFFTKQKHSLKHIVFPKQNYRMELETMKQFFLEYLFTQVGSAVEIEQFEILSGTFNQPNRADGLKAACTQVMTSNSLYSIKKLSLTDANYQINMSSLKCFLFTLQLQEFSYQKDSMPGDWDEIANVSFQYLDSLTQFHSLQVLRLVAVTNLKIQIYEFLEIFIFHEKMKLQELKLRTVTISKKDAQKNKLLKRITNIKEIISLKKLNFGEFTGSGEEDFLELLVFNKLVQLESLIMVGFSLNSKNLQQNNNLSLKILEFNYMKVPSKNDWQTVLDIFIIRQRQSLQSLSFVLMELGEKFASALNTLLLPFIQEVKIQSHEKQQHSPIEQNLSSGDPLLMQQHNSVEYITLPFTLNKLRYEKCNLTDDFFSGFLVVSELSNLQLLECEELNLSVPKCMNLIKSQKLDEFYSYKLKSCSCEGTNLENTSVFASLICEIALNQDRQLLQSLNIGSCQLNDETIYLFTEQLLKIKEEQKQFNRVFLLRDVDLSNNNQISAEAWSELWDVLLSKNKHEQHQQDSQIEQQEIQVDTFEEDNNKLVEDTTGIMTSTHLNLKEKVLYNYPRFTPHYPKQLLSLNLKMDFTFLSESEQKHEYYRIIVAYIVHPESQLQELVLDSLNLIIFIKACLEAYEFSKLYLEYAIHESKQEFKSKIQSIKFTSLAEIDTESLDRFFQMFLCSNHIELQKLTVSGSSHPMIQSLLKQINRRDKYVLEELCLPDIEETLSQNLAEQFMKQIIFGEKLPVKVLICSPKIENLNIQSFQQIDCTKNQIVKLQIIYNSDSKQQVQFYQFILERLLITNLSELEIETRDATVLISNLFDKLPSEQISLRKLTINGEMTFNKKRFEFLGSILDKLVLLKITTLRLQNEQEIYDACQLMDNNQSRCRLDIKELKCNSLQDGFKKMIFNPNVGFTDLVIRSTELFSNLQIYDLRQKIRYLNLNMGLLFNSNIQLNDNALSILGEMLIYNEQSKLEDLILHQCHFKEPAVAALVKAAGVFKQKVENQKSTAILSLKRVMLYHALYIGNDGFENVAKNILYYDYISIEKFELQVINLNDIMVMSLCKAAQNWLEFQQQNNRKYQTFYPLKYLDIGRNEFVEEQEAWTEFLTTFVFTDKTPNLDTFNIHFMALNDLKTSYVVEQALQFLDQKPSSYRFPVKRINFSQNTALTHVGWKNLFSNFLFHSKVYLQELNYTNTMLDSKLKIEVVSNAIKQRALQSPDNNVPLHTFLCYNIRLKFSVYQYLSERPTDYQILTELPVEIEYDNSTNIGTFDGAGSLYGEVLQYFQRILELRTKAVHQKDWYQTRYKYSPYHLNLCDNYLKILNQYYQEQNNTQVSISLNLQTLDLMASYFKYTIEYPGEPYPYNLLFQQKSFDYFSEKECNIFTIKILQIEFPELEQINQFQVLRLWENVKNNKTSIDQIQVEYYLNDDLIDEMFRLGYDESDIVQLVRIIPPSKIRIQNSLSIQAIKGIYSVLYDTYYFQYSMISYSFDNFLNIGIGYAMREVCYSYQAEGVCRRFLKKLFYKVFNHFVQPTKQYLFNNEAKTLNEYLWKQKRYFFIIAFVNLIFFVVTLGGPYLFTHFYNGDELQIEKDYYCLNGPSKEASYLYYSFAVISAIVESILYYQVAEIVPSYINKIIIKAVVFDDKKNEPQDVKRNKIIPLEHNDDLIIEKSEQTNQGMVSKLKTAIKKTITQLSTQAQKLTESKWGYYIAYILVLIQSQLYKFDLYNDVVFILNCLYCGEDVAFILALITTAFSQGIFFLQFLFLIWVRTQQNDKTAKLLSSKFINDFYKMSFIGRNAALTTLLDSTAPFNVVVIPNTKFYHSILPNQAGKAMSNFVKSYFFQFFFEDLPQITLQAYFLASQSIRRSGSIQAMVYVSILVSINTAFSSFYKFLSIRPTNLLQNDFDELQAKQQKLYKNVLNQNLKAEQEQIELYTKLFSKQHIEAIHITDKLAVEEGENLLS